MADEKTLYDADHPRAIIDFFFNYAAIGTRTRVGYPYPGYPGYPGTRVRTYYYDGTFYLKKVQVFTITYRKVEDQGKEPMRK